MNGATWTLPCDECGQDTSAPAWCDHGRVSCWTCDGECRLCQRERLLEGRDDL